MSKTFLTLAILCLLGAAGEYHYIHHMANGPYSKTSYQDLRPRLQILKRSYDDLTQQKPSKEVWVRVESTKDFLSKDMQRLKKEMLMRQSNMLLGVGSVVFFLLAFVRILTGSSGRMKTPKSSFAGEVSHSGKVKQESPRVSYIQEDDLHRRLSAGYADQQGAEEWLRSDPFLYCSNCQTPAKVEFIGSVQELIFYEEARRGVPKDQLKKLGTAWVAKPIDRFTCHKCGREIHRSVR